MTIQYFIAELKRLLPESSWPWVTRALLEDSIVWDSLVKGMGERLIEKGSIIPEDYSPAALALMALNLELTPEKLRQQPMERAETDIQLPENLPTAVHQLAEQGLSALKARERRRLTGSYQRLYEDLSAITPTTLACLYAMVPDPFDLLSGMVKAAYGVRADAGSICSLVLHAILANPTPTHHQEPVIRNLLNGLPLSRKITFLSLLNDRRPDITSQLSLTIARDNTPTSSGRPSVFDMLEHRYWAAIAWRLADKPEEEIRTLAETVKDARQLQARLTTRLAQAASENNDPHNAFLAWEQALRLEPDVPQRMGGYILTLIDNQRLSEARERLESYQNTNPHPKLVLARALLDQIDGDLQSARDNASQAFSLLDSSLNSRVENPPGAPSESAVLEDGQGEALSDLIRLANLFVKLNAPFQAVQSIRSLLKARKDDAECLALAVKIFRSAGDPQSAVQAAHLATSLDPERADLRRGLVCALEEVGDWVGALSERRILLSDQESPSLPERLDYALCSLEAGHLDQAKDACQSILEDEPDNGLAHTILGQVYFSQGKPQKAFDRLDLGTQLSPDEPHTWIALAETHLKDEQPEKAIEALKAGVQTSPNLPELQLALGEQHLSQDSPTQALNVFKRAAELIGLRAGSASTPQTDLAHARGELQQAQDVDLLDEASLQNRKRDAQIALRLGQTLQHLGHIQEAHRILEHAYSNYPYDPSIAHAYAQTLVALGELSSAMEPLAVVLESKPDQPAPYLDYAGCLLSLNARAVSQGRLDLPLDKALEAIRTALEIDPQCSQAKAYLAEALYAQGDYQVALEAYQKALETELISDPNWFSKLSLGLGRAALELGHVETAIAALQEANQADPAKVGIKRTLAEAYHAAGLLQEAYQTAQAALHQAPDDLETLIWFAEHILSLGDNLENASATAEAEAIDVLERALQIDPYRTDLAVRLGHIYLKAHQKEAARKVFESLLSEDKNDPAGGYHSTSRDVITDLHQAARGFLLLGQYNSAVDSLQRALQTKPQWAPQGASRSSGSTTSLFTLLSDLALAYQFAGDLQAALRTLDQAIPLAEVKTPLYITRADLFLDMEEYFDAMETVSAALEEDADNAGLHYRLALIQRAAGNTDQALHYAQKALALSDPQDPSGSFADNVTLAAELHQALLQDDLADQIINDGWELLKEQASKALDNVMPEKVALPSGILDFFCQHAESAITRRKFDQAIQDLGALLEISPGHSRVMAIQARLAAHRFDADGSLYVEAERLLETALTSLSQAPLEAGLDIETLKNLHHPQSGAFDDLHDRLMMISSRRSVAQAAFDLNQWDTSVTLFQEVAKFCPTEPRAHLSLARALIVTAEYQRRCEELEAISHAPGESALGEAAFEKFENSIELAETFLKHYPDQAAGSDSGEIDSDHSISLEPIQLWRVRGQAVFKPSFKTAKEFSKLPLTPEDIAAHVACLRLVGDTESATLAANPASHHPLVLAEMALTLASENSRQSLAAAHAAIENLAGKLEGNHTDVVTLGSRNLALIHILAARLIHRLGNRSSDQKAALNAIRVALTIWPDEPRWHYLAAEIHLKSEDPDLTSARLAAVAHLEEACHLEPDYPGHPLELGRIFLLEGSPEQAIPHLEKAVDLNADLAAAWYNLARAQQVVGEIDQALVSADKAVSLSPGETAPLLLRGDLALQIEQADRALEFAEKALELSADNPSGLLLKARSLSALDQPESALKAIESALPYADDPLPLFLERIRLIQQAQGGEAALEAMQGLAEAYPEEPKVLASLARRLERTGREDEAIQAVQRALRAEGLSTPPTPIERSEMHHILGRLLKNAGQLDQAIHHLTEAIRLDSRRVEPYLELGRVHQERRQNAQALKAYEQAIAARPEDHRAYFEAGVALKENKDYLGAERMLRRAAELAPNNLSVHRMLGAVVALNLVHNRRKEPTNI